MQGTRGELAGDLSIPRSFTESQRGCGGTNIHANKPLLGTNWTRLSGNILIFDGGLGL